MNQAKSKTDMTEFCGLWKQVSKSSGETYLSGRVGDSKYMIFLNKFKKSDKEPDYRCFVQRMPERYPPPPQPEPKAPRPMTSPFSEQSMAPNNNDDDIPF